MYKDMNDVLQNAFTMPKKVKVDNPEELEYKKMLVNPNELILRKIRESLNDRLDDNELQLTKALAEIIVLKCDEILKIKSLVRQEKRTIEELKKDFGLEDNDE
jgi:hypothetical protein